MFDELKKVLDTSGALAVIPTDTVYGVVARAADPAAVERLYALKQRENKPGTLIAANIEQLVELGVKRRYLTAVEQFWPGAVSVVVPTIEPALAYLHLNKYSLALRIPDNAELKELLEQTGPLLTTSANQPSQPPATTIKAARAYFDDRVDAYIDGGDLSDRQASTIIRIVDDAIEILRPGAVDIQPNE